MVSNCARSLATSAKNKPYDCPSDVLLRSKVMSITRPSACTKRATKSFHSGQSDAAWANVHKLASTHHCISRRARVLMRMGPTVAGCGSIGWRANARSRKLHGLCGVVHSTLVDPLDKRIAHRPGASPPRPAEPVAASRTCGA